MNNRIKQIHTNNARSKQEGYTIAEILIGVIVSLSVIAMVYAGWNSISESHQSEKMSQQVFSIVQNVRLSYSKSATGYTNIAGDMKSLIQEKVFPDTLVVNSSGGTVNNNFGGQVTLTSDANTGGFILTFTKVPSSICVSYLKISGGTGLQSVDVGGKALWTTGSQWPDKNVISEACGAGVGAQDMAFHAN